MRYCKTNPLCERDVAKLIEIMAVSKFKQYVGVTDQEIINKFITKIQDETT